MAWMNAIKTMQLKNSNTMQWFLFSLFFNKQILQWFSNPFILFNCCYWLLRKMATVAKGNFKFPFILNFLLYFYYFCHERDENEKKIGTSKDPLSFINKSISLPPEFSWKFCNYRGIILKYLYFQYVFVYLFRCWTQHFKINFDIFQISITCQTCFLLLFLFSMKVRLFTWIEFSCSRALHESNVFFFLLLKFCMDAFM